MLVTVRKIEPVLIVAAICLGAAAAAIAGYSPPSIGAPASLSCWQALGCDNHLGHLPGSPASGRPSARAREHAVSGQSGADEEEGRPVSGMREPGNVHAF